MDFMTGFKELKEGKKIARRKWIDEYLIIKDEIIIHIDTEFKIANNYIIEMEDLFSDDWEVVK